MNSDQIKGEWNQVKGKAQEAWGDVKEHARERNKEDDIDTRDEL